MSKYVIITNLGKFVLKTCCNDAYILCITNQPDPRKQPISVERRTRCVYIYGKENGVIRACIISMTEHSYVHIGPHVYTPNLPSVISGDGQSTLVTTIRGQDITVFISNCLYQSGGVLRAAPTRLTSYPSCFSHSSDVNSQSAMNWSSGLRPDEPTHRCYHTINSMYRG